MTINFPVLDTRDESEVVASVIDNFPAEITNRNPGGVEVKLTEAVGAFYGKLLFALEQYPQRLILKLLELTGIDQTAATTATVELTVTATAAGGTLPAGHQVKSGSGTDAVVFTTDAAITLGASASGIVNATAATAGAAANVPIGALQTFDPVVGIDTITNATAAAGGADLEALDAMIARAPVAARVSTYAITDEDFETWAMTHAEVERADGVGGYGLETVHVILGDLNERYYDDPFNAFDAAVRSEVRTDLMSRTLGGVDVVITQTSYRLFAVTAIEVELLAGYTIAGVSVDIQNAMGKAATAFDLFEPDGSQVGEKWIYLEPIYKNEIISAVDRVAGVRRVGAITSSISDDMGATWSTPGAMPDSIAAAADGGNTINPYALIHWGGPQPVDTDGDQFTGLPAVGWYGGYLLSVVEL